MTLSPSELVQALAKVWPAGGLPSELPSLPERINITSDSRQITPGDVFVAIPGGRFDGRDFIDNAIAAGAGLVLAHVSQGILPCRGACFSCPISRVV